MNHKICREEPPASPSQTLGRPRCSALPALFPNCDASEGAMRYGMISWEIYFNTYMNIIYIYISIYI